MKKFIFLFSILFLVSFTELCYSQTGWIPLTSNTTRNLNRIYFVNSNLGFVVGDSSTILKTTNSGTYWANMTSPVFSNFKDVRFINANTGYISGSNGKIIKTTNGGQNWIDLNLGDTNTFFAIFFIADTGYASGSNGKIIKTTNGGINWTQKTSNTTFQLNSIYFLDSQNGYICGGNNASLCIVLKTINGGNNWAPQQKTQVASWTKIFFPNSVTGWIVGYNPGDSGVVSRTTDGGTVWSYRTILTTVRLNSTYWFDGNSGYIAGNNGTIIRARYGFTGMTFDTSGTTNNLMDITYSGSSMYAVGTAGKIIVKSFQYLKAYLNSIYEPNAGRINTKYFTFSDSSSVGSKDTVAWYVNNQFVSNQHSFTYAYPQGTTFVKLILKDRYFSVDTATAVVSRGIFSLPTLGSIKAGCSLIGDSVLYAISTGYALYNLTINGGIRFTLGTNGDILSSCSIGYDTTIFLTSTDRNLYGFDKLGGALWPAYPLGAVATTTPVVDSISNRLYVGASNGNFFAINKTNGSNAWTFLADAPVKSSAVIGNRKLLFLSSKGTVYGFNLSSPMMNPPTPNWIKYLGDSLLTSPAVDKYGHFWIGTKSGKLYRIRLRGNHQADSIMVYNFNSEITNSPVIDASSNIYVATADKKLHSLKFGNFNNHNYQINWEYTSSARIGSTPAISKSHRVYFGNDAGELIGLDTINGNIKFYYLDSIGSKISCPILYKCGSIYAGNEAGKIFAFYDSTSYDTSEIPNGILGGVKSVPIWGQFQNNVRRNGVLDSVIVDTIPDPPFIQKNTNIIPDKFELKQNYPNPFNPSTVISIQIKQLCDVRLVVYDILGREVDVLVNQKLNAGFYDVTFNADKYSSGLYFYRMKAGDFIETKKMIILK